MYKKSPNKFFAAGMAGLSAVNNVGTNNKLAQLLASRQGGGGLLSNIGSAISQSSQQVTGVPTIGAASSTGIIGADQQVSQAAQAAVKGGSTMGVSNPLSGNGGPAGSSNPFGGQKFEITPVQMTYDTPTPGNEMGNATPLFNDTVTDAGNMMFGDVGQRQRSLQNQAGDIQAKQYVKDPSALQGNAFGLAMEQAGGDYDKAKEIIKNK